MFFGSQHSVSITQRVFKNVVWPDLNGDFCEVLCPERRERPWLGLRADWRRAMTFELALECARRSLPDLESCWRSQGCRWRVMTGYGACGNTEGRSACLEQSECWGKCWMGPKDGWGRLALWQSRCKLVRVVPVCGKRKQSETIKNVLEEERLVSFCWWRTVSRVSSVCLLGGHEARQRNRVVSRGSQEETDGCSWRHAEFEETEKPLKGCVVVWGLRQNV